MSLIRIMLISIQQAKFMLGKKFMIRPNSYMSKTIEFIPNINIQ
jgi:hypothetical protein